MDTFLKAFKSIIFIFFVGLCFNLCTIVCFPYVTHSLSLIYDLSENGNGIDHSSPSNGHAEQGEQRKFSFLVPFSRDELFRSLFYLLMD